MGGRGEMLTGKPVPQVGKRQPRDSSQAVCGEVCSRSVTPDFPGQMTGSKNWKNKFRQTLYSGTPEPENGNKE